MLSRWMANGDTAAATDMAILIIHTYFVHRSGMFWMNLKAVAGNWVWSNGEPYGFNAWASGSQPQAQSGKCGTVGKLGNGNSGFGGRKSCTTDTRDGYICERTSGK